MSEENTSSNQSYNPGDSENDFGEVMAELNSFANLMWSHGDSDGLSSDQVKTLGRGMNSALKRANGIFDSLLSAHLKERAASKK